MSKISKRCVGVDAHIDPANGTDFTGISGESVGAQWGDVGIAPYANFKIMQNLKHYTKNRRIP